ncbi:MULTISPECIES: phage tail-collar fiber domain-containing protein [unclassified Escherichia]|uniref:phage tail-collar fiber domain-containing protein n=2 Tax=Escherichia TaxID=561 RepID=UPI000CF7A2AA|nr:MULTISPECIES: phage tail protein [unclassified Escherichia]EFB2831320.1 phage tail protein [Escherichia coli]EFO2097829.1 phage tail protein [Escherichia coli]MBB2344430.1 phage tail protein [Escherichia sp. 93.0743]MCF7287661.1 phage tail protein [Escherichia coli]MCX1033666.1 phage tail protein [Escherichia coli]
MDNEFYTLLTDRGMAKIANALADKKQLHLQKMAVGDSGGQYYEPTVSQTKLRHEVWRGDLNTLTVAPNNPNWLIAELVLPENIGGWYVREVGVFDTDGELIAIGKFPESYKPLLPGGSGKQVCIRLIMEVSNTAAVTLTVDPSIVLATRDYVDSQLDEHERSTNHPDATLSQKGFTQLSNATDSDDETKAATPKAVKAAMIEARNHRHTWSQITDIPDGTLTQKGIVKLSNAIDSTSTTEAATPSAVKAAYDLANSKAAGNHTHPWGQITGVPDGTLSQKGIVKLNNATDSNSTTEAATPSAVKAAYDKAGAAYSRSTNSHIQFFTTNGTFTVPDGVSLLFIEMLGGGGGGGGGGYAKGNSGFPYSTQGFGGQCGETKLSIVTVIPGTNYAVTVGAGGVGGQGGKLESKMGSTGGILWNVHGSDGMQGGNSSFADSVAYGGTGGNGSGNTMVDQHSAPGGNGMNSLYGLGGIGLALSNGGNAVGYGAGGAGGSAANNQTSASFSGGRGSDGFVKISW